MTREQSNNLLALALWATFHNSRPTEGAAVARPRQPPTHKSGFPHPASARIAGVKAVSVIIDEAECLNETQL